MGMIGTMLGAGLDLAIQSGMNWIIARSKQPGQKQSYGHAQAIIGGAGGTGTVGASAESPPEAAWVPSAAAIIARSRAASFSW